MSEIDDLVQRAVTGVTAIAGRAARFAGRLLLMAIVVCGGGFLLGVAALSDSNGVQAVWIVLGIVFGAIAIGGSFLAWWRVGAVKRHVPELAAEVRTLISEGKDTGRTVVETFVVDTDGDGRRGDPNTGSAIVLSRQMYGFRNVVGSGLESSARLTAAITALTSFPGLVLAAVLVTCVFAFFGFVFLIALAL
jgi:hypothetical protein